MGDKFKPKYASAIKSNLKLSNQSFIHGFARVLSKGFRKLHRIGSMQQVDEQIINKQSFNNKKTLPTFKFIV